ncbi:zinc finger protein 91 isoform X2 [Engraulis encrasicolus]|uniref:zinc finger protein 91 isoform X2 n=1 Tax=Engraulis encrasicolus TaxID=184585 RepID=UPI002FD6A91B
MWTSPPSHFNSLNMAMHDISRAKGFPCKECDMICPSTPSLLEHMKAHYQQEESGRFDCEQCGRVFKNANSLASHKKSHEVGSFQCPVCTRTLPNALALKNHLRIHTLSPSAQAEEDNEDPIEDERDYGLAQDLSDTGFRSHLSNSGMMGHDHDGQNDKQKSPHGTEDAWDRPFKCDQCDRTYRHHGSLVNHKKSHQEGAFKCTICYKQFNNLAALSAHERTHSKFKPPGLMSDGSLDQSDSRHNDDMASCFCHLCQVALPNKTDFQEHILLHNAASSSLGLTRGFPGIVPHNLSTVRSPGVHPYTPALGDPLPLPPLPDKRYDQMLGPPVNNPIYTCAYCGAGHPDLESLKVHYLTHDPHPPPHTQDGPSILNTDSLGSNSQPSVSSPGAGESRGGGGSSSQQQSSSADDGDRRFKCNECGKSYRHAGSLVNHKRCHQTGHYQCTICCKQYPHLAALHSHLRSHKGRPGSGSGMNSEGDWLSPEPLTLDSQQGFVQSHDQGSGATTPISLPGNLGDAAHFVSDGGHSSGLDSLEFHDRFDGASLSGSGNRQADRHMCADCGEMYSDISGIKSHMCPQRRGSGMSNGYMGYHGQGGSMPSGSMKDCGGQRGGQDQMQYSGGGGSSGGRGGGSQSHGGGHGGSGGGGGGKRMDNKGGDDEDDGEVYQCSVCGNHYASLRALRSHLRSHGNVPGAGQGAGPSNLSPTSEQEWRRQRESGESGGLMICSTCGQSFNRKQDLVNHQQLVHGITPREGSSGMSGSGSSSNGKMDGRNICIDCGNLFADRHHLVTHLCPGKPARGGGKGMNGSKGMSGGASTSSGLRSIGDGEKPHRCDQCGRCYRHPCSLLNHKKSHKTGVFRCLVCQKRYYNLLALKNHQRTHFDLKRHKCEECGKAFKIQKQLVNHLRFHEEQRAKGMNPNGGRYEGGQGSQMGNMGNQGKYQQNPGKYHHGGGGGHGGHSGHGSHMHHGGGGHQGFKKPYEGGPGTSRPINPDDPEGRRPFACDQCGRTYRHAGSLANHKNLHKTGEYHCNVCNSTYPNRLAMKNHLRMHFAMKKFTCPDCGRGFRTQRQLETHTTNQLCKDLPGPSGIADYECDGCGEGFSTATELASHDCQMPSSSAMNMSGEGDDPDARPFACDLCGCSYKHASSLLNHKNTHKTGDFSCTFCDKPYTNYMALRNHMRIHTQKKRHICNTCGKAFRLARFLRNHQRVHEEGHTRFGCPSCGKSFQGRSGLARHRCGDNQVGKEGRRKAASNEGEECRFTCDQCGRSYRHASSLLNHKNTHTVGIYHCAVCLKTYSNLLALKNHRRIHSETRRHRCPECGKAFRVSSQLQNHRKVHLKQRELVCTLCQRSFTSQASFRLHQEMQHGIARPKPQHHSHHSSSHGGSGSGGGSGDLGWGSGLDLTLMQAQGLDPNGLPKLTPSLHGSGGSGRDGEASMRGKAHVCNQCGRAYRHASSLLNHKNSHKTGTYFCNSCQKEFSNLMALKNHRRIHTEPKRYQCPDCGKSFRVSTQLICHRRIHTKEKPFSCQQCDKRFSSKSNLRHHQKVHWSSPAPTSNTNTTSLSSMGAANYLARR